MRFKYNIMLFLWNLFILFIFIFPCYAWELHKFDSTDNKLFASVCVFQIIDGLTTVNLLKKDNGIKNDWAWKYRTQHPSIERLWAVKGAELLGAYYLGKMLPNKFRKGFFILVNATLIYCINNNLSLGAGLSITF